MAFEWEKNDPINKPWEANDPIVGEQPSFRGTGATGTWEEGDPVSIPARFGKQLINIASQSIKETLYGLGGGKVDSWIAAIKINKTLKERGIEPPTLRETQKRFKQTVLGEYEKGVPEFDIAPATTIGEKAIDIAAGTTGFVAKLVILKKAFPGVSGPALWDMEHISSGGMPGVGAATYGVFNLPGKVIKGVTIAAKAGRVASESALLGGISAVHQKIETGEVDSVEVLTSMGIGLVMGTLGERGRTKQAKKILQQKLKEGDVKAIKAVNEAIVKKTDIPPGSNVYKTKKGKIVVEKPADIGTPQGTVMRNGRVYEAKKGGVELLPAPELSVSGKAPVKPVSGQTQAEALYSTNKRVIEWAEKGKQLNKTERKAAVHKLRQQQHARFTDVYKAERAAGTKPFEAAKIAKKARAGKAGTPEIEPLVLTPEQREVYGRRIESVYPESRGFERGGSFDAIAKMERGRIPTGYEFGLLEPIFGTEATTKLYTSLVGKKGLELWDIPTLVRDIPKALRFGFDPQAARGISKITIRHPLIYLNTLGKNIGAIFSKKYADRINKTIESSSAYKLGKKEYGANYLNTKPWASVRAGDKLEQFGHVSDIFLRSKNRIIRGIGVWLRASERGANAGMNSALNKLVIKGEKDLARYSRNRSLSASEMSAWRKRRGHDINIYTKRITAKHPKGKAIQRAANWLVFSPAYTASGLASGPQSFIKLATGKGFADRTYAMQIMLSRLAGLTAVSSAVGYVAHKHRLKNPTEEPLIDSSANPIDPLFGKIRAGNEVYDLGFGDVADYRLMARIGLSAYMETKRLLTGKETTTFRGKKVPTAGESFGRYLNSKRTLYLSLAKQLASGKDWLGNPVTLKDTALDNLPFEFFQAFVEAGEADGLWEDMASGIELDTAKKALHNLAPSIAALGGVGTGSYPTPTYVTRSKFRNIIAQKEHGKRWDDLTQIEQRKLSVKNRKAFDVFKKKIKEEGVEKPFSLQRMQEEQIKSGRKITKLLSKPNRLKVKGISVAVSRRPKNFYLNDERYQQYQELTASYLNERLSKLRLGGKSDKVKTKMLEVAIKLSKDKAFRDIRRQMR